MDKEQSKIISRTCGFYKRKKCKKYKKKCSDIDFCVYRFFELAERV